MKTDWWKKRRVYPSVGLNAIMLSNAQTVPKYYSPTSYLDEAPDGKNKTNRQCSFPRDWRLSASWRPN